MALTARQHNRHFAHVSNHRSPRFCLCTNYDPCRYPKDIWPGHKPPNHADGSSGANGAAGDGYTGQGGGGGGGGVAAEEVMEFFCDGCDDTIPTGTERMECAVCPDEFCLCHSCYDEGEVNTCRRGEGGARRVHGQDSAFFCLYGRGGGGMIPLFALPGLGQSRKWLSTSPTNSVLSYLCWRSVSSKPHSGMNVHIVKPKRTEA